MILSVKALTKAKAHKKKVSGVYVLSISLSVTLLASLATSVLRDGLRTRRACLV